MEKIFLSIIVPVYNTEKYLKDCLESIIQNTSYKYEIICVDDGSKDNSIDILQMYEKKYSFFKIISQKNGGSSSARNTGIREAIGEYIIFLDSDDMLYTDAIQKMCEKIESTRPEILVYDADCIYETELLKKTQFKDVFYHRKKEYGEQRCGTEMFCDMMEANDYCDSACLLAINRNWLIKENLFFKEGMIYEDSLFSFLCYMRAERVSHVNENYMIYRIREKSIMQTIPTFKYIEGRLEAYTVILTYMLNEDTDKKLQEALAKLEQFTRYNIKKIYTELDAEEKEKIKCLKGAKSVLYKMIFDDSKLKNCEDDLIIKGYEKFLDTEEDIYIYGAGKVGRSTYEFIKKTERAQKVKGFIVTKKDREIKIDGVKVFEIKELKDVDALILLCARKDFQEEMYLEAQKYKCKKVIPIDHRLEEYMSEKLYN